MYTTSVISKREVAEGTVAFHFVKPEGFTHIAGQSIDLTLVNPPETDAEGNTRAYTITSDPSIPEIVITTRMRDTAFKRVLKNMAEGIELTLEGPFGSFTLHENTKRAAVFLAGGIGITPFYSMITDATKRSLPHHITLFYSNRRPEDAAYLNELSACTEQNKNFMFIPTMTEMEKSSQTWNGATGYIDTALISKHVDTATNPIYYLAGPLSMVAAMRKILNEMGVSNDDIRTEEFTGY